MIIRPLWRIRRAALSNILRFTPQPRRNSRHLLAPVAKPRHNGARLLSSAAAVHHTTLRSDLAPSWPTEKQNAVDRGAVTKANSSRHRTKKRNSGRISRTESGINKLEPFLPPHLRSRRWRDAQVSTDIKLLRAVLGGAQASSGGSINLLAKLVLTRGRSQAALYLAELFLKDIASAQSRPARHPPSTLEWPPESLSQAMAQPVILTRPNNIPASSTQAPEYQYDTLPDGGASGLGYTWRFLGLLVVESANLSAEKATQTMSVVYQALAKAHNLNLIPQNVYAHVNLSHSSAIQRPPIIHLLASRILTTMSDATWRAYQDETISKAAEHGISYVETQDPPGGRFRLKVRDLGPEVWLEFILWCCVESDCPEAGDYLVAQLAQQTSDPWFAVNWTSIGDRASGVQIDWNRVRMRTGGTVGRIEGYSGDRPLAEMPSRTISAEVVLALVESSVNYTNSAVVKENARFNTRVPRTVQRLISFLEPHNLPEEYFDYLTARLVDSTSDTLSPRPLALRFLTDTLTQIRALESSEKKELVPTGLNFRTIVQQSELYAGMLHLAMHALGCSGHAREAIDAFDHIQAMVDGSKMQAIASFINTPAEARGGFFNAAPVSGDMDFMLSHGQVPYYRLAAFLDLLTSNDVVPLAEWLVYSMDADGPLLPGVSFQRMSVASALARFAGANDDPQLLQYVLNAMRAKRLKPPINLLRSLVNAQMQCLNFPAAAACLRALKAAIAGGYRVDNVACLASCILRLEKMARTEHVNVVQTYLDDAVALLEDILKGRFDGNPGDFYITQRQLFRQQVGHVLRICGKLDSPSLHHIALSYGHTFPTSNLPSLPPRSFNILLRGIVEAMGSEEGIWMYNNFCGKPADGIDQSSYLTDEASRVQYSEVDFAEGEDDEDVEVDESHPDSGMPLSMSQQPDSNGVGTTGPSETTEDGEQNSLSTDLSRYASDIRFSDADMNVGFRDLIELARPANETVSGTGPSRTVNAISGGPTDDDKPTPTTTTIPTVHTLRIIANKIIDEAKTPDLIVRDQARRLLESAWARETFHAFGLSDERIQAARITGGLNEEGTPMLASERRSVQAVDSATIINRKGKEIRQLFATEQRSWVSRLPRRVTMQTGSEQRRAKRRRPSSEDEGEKLRWLYERMAGQGDEGALDDDAEEEDHDEFEDEDDNDESEEQSRPKSNEAPEQKPWFDHEQYP